jgi:hypothetical protein
MYPRGSENPGMAGKAYLPAHELDPYTLGREPSPSALSSIPALHSHNFNRQSVLTLYSAAMRKETLMKRQKSSYTKTFFVASPHFALVLGQVR